MHTHHTNNNAHLHFYELYTLCTPCLTIMYYTVFIAYSTFHCCFITIYIITVFIALILYYSVFTARLKNPYTGNMDATISTTVPLHRILSFSCKQMVRHVSLRVDRTIYCLCFVVFSWAHSSVNSRCVFVCVAPTPTTHLVLFSLSGDCMLFSVIDHAKLMHAWA